MDEDLTNPPPELLDISIGSAIRQRRRQLELSQQELAAACGISFQQLQKYESGSNRISFSRLVHICLALRCRVAQLVGPLDAPDGISAEDAGVLSQVNVPGAAEMLSIFNVLPPGVRRSLIDLARAMNDGLEARNAADPSGPAAEAPWPQSGSASPRVSAESVRSSRQASAKRAKPAP